MTNYMKKNVNQTGVNLNDPTFNNYIKENEVNCSDLKKLIKFDNLIGFNDTITQLKTDSASLGIYSSCGSFR